MTQKWIQTPVSDKVFEEFSCHKKQLGQTWPGYILAALTVYKQLDETGTERPPQEAAQVHPELGAELTSDNETKKTGLSRTTAGLEALSSSENFSITK